MFIIIKQKNKKRRQIKHLSMECVIYGEQRNYSNGASAEEDTIDLMEIFRALRKRWYWIVLLAIIFGAALGVYGKFIVKDAYQAEASMCIIDSNKEVSMSDVQLGSALTGDYEGIIKSRVVLNKVIENLKLDLTYKQLYNIVSVENPDSTRILKIYVTAGTVREAVNIANEILSVSVLRQPPKEQSPDESNVNCVPRC